MFKIFTFISIIFFTFIAVNLSIAQVPPAPTNLTVEQMGNYAHLQWNASSGAIGYRVYRAVDTFRFVPIAVTQMRSYVDQFVFPGHIYRYYVTAYNYAGESPPSNDVTFIPNQPPPSPIKGYIAGTIVDDATGQPIRGVRVRFFRTNGFVYFREARTDTAGFYMMPLDTGRYLVFATKWTYIPEWYDNVLTPQDATPLNVTPNNTSIANFGLTRTLPPPPPRLVTVSGTVTDSIENTPIEGAFVVIMRTNRQINIIQNFEGSMFGHRGETFFIPGIGTLIGVMGVARTDNLGNYNIQVPDSLTYIMLAYKHGYILEFYNNKRTPDDADRLFLTGNTSGINFDLVRNPNQQNSLTGTVKNSWGDGVFSKVVIFQKFHRGVFPIRFTITDTAGNYSFNNLYPGYYYAKAIPFAFYAPAWYDADSCGVIGWVNADSFMVSGNTTGIDICVVPIDQAGFATISGTVTESGNSTRVQGVTVYAVSSSMNNVVGYDITESDGTFKIQNLAPGTYKIVLDKEGYSSPTSPEYTVDESNNYTVSGAELNIVNVTLGIGEKDDLIPKNYTLEQNYPNPFNPITEINFGLPTASKVNISVYNLLGQLVNTLINKEIEAGIHSVTWDGTDANNKTVSSGVYFYKITAHSLDNSYSFSSVRKMLFIK